MLRYRSLWLVLGWLTVATIVWLSLTPSPPDPGIEHADKVGHFLAYEVLMFWFCQLYERRLTRAAYAAGFVAMGVALEFIQGALGNRSQELFDMVANTLGVLIGWALAATIGSVLARIERLDGP